MHQLAWYDYSNKLVAYGQAADKIEDKVVCQERNIPVTMWPVKRLTYTHTIGAKLEMFPLSLLLPQFVLRLDDVQQQGSSRAFSRRPLREIC